MANRSRRPSRRARASLGANEEKLVRLLVAAVLLSWRAAGAATVAGALVTASVSWNDAAQGDGLTDETCGRCRWAGVDSAASAGSGTSVAAVEHECRPDLYRTPSTPAVSALVSQGALLSL